MTSTDDTTLDERDTDTDTDTTAAGTSEEPADDTADGDEPQADDSSNAAGEAPPTGGRRHRVGRTRPLALSEVAVAAAQLAGLWALAVAEPVLSAVRSEPTFLVAQGATGARAVVFALVLVLVPPAILTGVVAAVGAVSAGAARVALAVFVGLLGALVVMGLVDGAMSMPAPVAVVALGAVATGLALAYRRWAALRTYATVLVFAPVLFVVVFLTSDGVRSVAFAAEPVAAGLARDPAPVVMVVLDEFPLGTILTPEGDINADAFEGFARLSRVATWYPNARAVAPYTNVAVPALLTGHLPDLDAAPLAANHPRSLFTMLGEPGRVEAVEALTFLCPASLCEGGAPRPDTLWGDTVVLAGHRALPAGLADAWFPPLGNTWADFAGGGGGADGIDGIDEQAPMSLDEFTEAGEFNVNLGPQAGFDTLSASIEEAVAGADTDGRLWYLHVELPHMPLHYLSDGRRYNGDDMPASMSQWQWIGTDPHGTVTLRQRMLMQTQYADALVGGLLDTLEDTGLLDQALVVVTSDHGLSLEPGAHRRAHLATLDSIDGSMPVPLFIHYPGQDAGEVDERPALLTDVTPTVADVLDVELPAEWTFDGVSLRDPEPPARPRWWMTDRGERIHLRADPTRMAARDAEALGPLASAGDAFRLGPHGDLVGRSVDELSIGPVRGRVSQDQPGLLGNVELSGVLPTLVTAEVSGLSPGTWLAVALNGVVAGLGPVYSAAEGGATVADVMVDPTWMRAGDNDVEVFSLDSRGGLRPAAGS